MFESAVEGLAEAVAELSATVSSGLSDACLVDVISAAEVAKRALAAVQAEATAALSVSVRAAEAAAGVPAAKRGRGVGPQVAAARRVSPNQGGRFVGAALALVEDLPNTFDALKTGLIEEWTATQVVRETVCLAAEDRARVDAGLLEVLTRPGAGAATVIGSARALAQQVDSASAVARARMAANERCVSFRPAPDTMVYVTALLPVAQGVAVQASLSQAVKDHATTRAPGDERGRGQVMADTFTERLTGRDPYTEPVPVVVHLVMDTDTLLDAGKASANIPGHGPIPARLARDLVGAAAEKEQAWVRRLFTAPDSSQLMDLESKQRAFPAGLAAFVRARDQRCAAPYCDAPIRHPRPHHPSCEGWVDECRERSGVVRGVQLHEGTPRVHLVPRSRHRVTTWETPTGHTYASSPPPVLGHPRLPDPEDEIAGTRAWLRRVSDTAA